MKTAATLTAKEFNNWLNSQGACNDAMTWIDGRSLSEAWVNAKRSDWMIWLLWKAGAPNATLRRIACACVRKTPLVDGRFVWDLLTDERSRNAVVVAEAYAEGNATDEERDAARNAAWAAARDAARAAAGAAARNAAWAAAGAAARNAARNAAWDAAWAAAGAAARNAAWDAAGDAARDAARDAQCNLISEHISAEEVEELIVKDLNSKKELSL